MSNAYGKTQSNNTQLVPSNGGSNRYIVRTDEEKGQLAVYEERKTGNDVMETTKPTRSKDQNPPFPETRGFNQSQDCIILLSSIHVGESNQSRELSKTVRLTTQHFFPHCFNNKILDQIYNRSKTVSKFWFAKSEDAKLVCKFQEGKYQGQYVIDVFDEFAEKLKQQMKLLRTTDKGAFIPDQVELKQRREEMQKRKSEQKEKAENEWRKEKEAASKRRRVTTSPGSIKTNKETVIEVDLTFDSEEMSDTSPYKTPSNLTQEVFSEEEYYNTPTISKTAEKLHYESSSESDDEVLYQNPFKKPSYKQKNAKSTSSSSSSVSNTATPSNPQIQNKNKPVAEIPTNGPPCWCENGRPSRKNFCEPTSKQWHERNVKQKQLKYLCSAQKSCGFTFPIHDRTNSSDLIYHADFLMWHKRKVASNNNGINI